MSRILEAIRESQIHDIARDHHGREADKAWGRAVGRDLEFGHVNEPLTEEGKAEGLALKGWIYDVLEEIWDQPTSLRIGDKNQTGLTNSRHILPLPLIRPLLLSTTRYTDLSQAGPFRQVYGYGISGLMGMDMGKALLSNHDGEVDGIYTRTSAQLARTGRWANTASEIAAGLEVAPRTEIPETPILQSMGVELKPVEV